MTKMGKQRIVLVTGATSGIGRETSLHLARMGHRVFATGRKIAALEELAREAEGLELETFQLDVTDARSIEVARTKVDQRTDGYGLDVLVNNAGYCNMAPMEQITDEDLRGQFETNVFGLVTLTQKFLPAMRARGAGRIVNVSSVVGRLSLPLQGIYCATKHAVEALSDAWRMELAPFGVHVSLVEPGTIRTGFEATATSTVSRYQAAESPYKPAIVRYREVVADSYKRAPGPACIARTVARIVRARRPRARYVSPRYNRFLIWLVNKLPTRWVDGLIRRVMGLTRKALLPPPGGTEG